VSAPARAVLITGCSTGIGRVAAIRFAALGWRVYAGVRRETDAEALRAECDALRPLILDVTDAAQIEDAVGAIEAETGGRLDALVNNAARVLIGPIEATPVEDARSVVEVNVLGVVAVTRRCLPLLRRAAPLGPGSRIVNVGSTSGIVAWPFSGAYVASKFALEGLSDALRLELIGTGVDVSVIIAGSVRTPIWEKTHASFEACAGAMGDDVARVYGKRFEAARRAVRSSPDAIEPGVVVRAIEHALTSRRPRTRYVVGRSARKQWLLRRLLPDRAADRIRLAMIEKRARRSGADERS
jgi:NAD(P)-dependent dehydrogenase (short-subunit alcohol dehydrogenase family)